jgi:aryl-alcohol dehydrogenase-like predicted oxidoreductase
MKKVVLGRTGLEVSQLGFGGLFVASFAAELEQAKQSVKRAVELGINYFDTAPSYGNSEEVLGKALRDIRQPVILSTKLGGRPQPFKPQDKEGLLASFRESLRLLGRDKVDILMIHEPDRPGQYDWWPDWENINGPVLEVLYDLRKQGLIKYLGLGGTTAYELAHVIRSGKFDVVLTAFNYSLLWREAALEVIPAAREQKMGIIAGSPLQQGGLARRYEQTVKDGAPWLARARQEQLKKLYALLDECGIPLPELALRFVISNPDIHCVLMGARSAAETEQNAAAIEKGPLPKALLKKLDKIAALVPYRPFEEPFSMSRLGNPKDYKGAGPAC